MRRVVPVLLSLLFAATAGAQPFSSLEERMSAADFRAAGLDKLSDAELAHLNEWLRRQAPAAPVVDRGPPVRGSSRSGGLLGGGDRIVARMVGDYDGRSGRGTRFTLDNGQVWEVTDSSGRLASQRMAQPTVVITPGVLGVHYLRLDGYNAQVQVQRVK